MSTTQNAETPAKTTPKARTKTQIEKDLKTARSAREALNSAPEAKNRAALKAVVTAKVRRLESELAGLTAA